MKKILAFLVFVLSLTLLKSGYTYPVAMVTLPELIQKSDVICVGTTQSIKITGEEQDRIDNLGLFEQLKGNVPSAFPSTGDFVVEQVIKGTLAPGHVTIPFLSSNPRLIDGPYFRPLVAGERVILFLTQKRGVSSPVLEMTSAETFPGPKIVMGNTPVPYTLGLSPYRAVLTCLVAGLTNKDPAVRLMCLERLSDGYNIGLLLYPPKSAFFAAKTAQIRQELGEPPGTLEAFVEQNVVPTVLRAATDTDEQVRLQAIRDAAEFQRMETLPQLIEMIQNGKMDAYPVTFYRNADAAPYLLPLLNADSPDVRLETADTLARIKSRIALPALLTQMNTPHPEVNNSGPARYSIIGALYAITGIPQPKDFFLKADATWDLSPEKAQQYISFWNAWAKQHQAELDKLQYQRDQFQKLQKRTPSRLSLQSRIGKAA